MDRAMFNQIHKTDRRPASRDCNTHGAKLPNEDGMRFSETKRLPQKGRCIGRDLFSRQKNAAAAMRLRRREGVLAGNGFEMVQCGTVVVICSEEVAWLCTRSPLRLFAIDDPLRLLLQQIRQSSLEFWYRTNVIAQHSGNALSDFSRVMSSAASKLGWKRAFAERLQCFSAFHLRSKFA